jgi:hypothetical protein
VLRDLAKQATLVLVVAVPMFVVTDQIAISTLTIRPSVGLIANLTPTPTSELTLSHGETGTAPPDPTTTPTPVPSPTPTPKLAPSPALAAACQPSPLPATIAATGAEGLYKGPLFDAHLHLLRDTVERFGSAEALCRYLEKDQTLWALGFYSLPPEPDRGVARAMPTIRGARGRIVPLVDPPSSGPFSGAFTQGKYMEDVLKTYLQPQGPLQGVGEIALYQESRQSVTFESPPMQTVFRVSTRSRASS